MAHFAGGIRFNDCVFTEPVNLGDWKPPSCAGLLVVLAHDPAWSPRPFRPLYFGEFGNDTHIAPGTAPYLISVVPMPYSTTRQRQNLCGELVSAYNPILQTSGSIQQLFAAPPTSPRRAIGFRPDTATA